METLITNTQDNQRKVTEEELLNAIRTIMLAIGEDPEREGLIDTPARIARMYREIFRGYKPEYKPAITTFTNSAHTSEMVFDTGEYFSMCEHHMLPFFGKYYFAYIPNADGRILGISKVARVVSYCAAKLQLQERLCREIIEMLSEALDGTACGFAIVMKGKHLCKSMRGIRNDGDMTVSYFTGAFKEDSDLRREFFNMVQMQ